MKQKLFSFLFAIVASIGTMSSAGTKIGDFYYYLNANDLTAEVTYEYYGGTNNYLGLTTANIPASITYNGATYSVTSIGNQAFCKCSSLTSVTIPNGVTSIGGGAFSYCSKLTSVTIPRGVINIERSPFSYCSSLTSIIVDAQNSNYHSEEGVLFTKDKTTLISYPGGKQGAYTVPNSATSIGEIAFCGCSGLTSVTIPNSLTSIGYYAFYDCSGLTSVTIPNSVTNIGDRAFSGCSNLITMAIPNSVTQIGSDAFNNIPNIMYSGTASGSPWGARNINGFVDGWLVYDDSSQRTLVLCSPNATGEIIIPNAVMTIRSSAFEGCNNISSVIVGDSVTSIEYETFSNCSVTSVTIGKSVTSIAEYAFWGCDSLTSVIWNAKRCNDFTFDNTPFYRYKNYGVRLNIRERIKSFTFGDEVEYIPAYLCTGMTNLDSLSIGSGISTIRAEDFSGCNNIKHIALKSNAVVSNMYSASDNFCTLFGPQVQTYTLGNSVTNIGDYAFYGGSNISSIGIPNSIVGIGSSAFYGCSEITSFDIPEGVTAVLPNTFFGCSGLQSVSIPSSVVSIGNEAFGNCSQLSQVTISSNTVVSKACTPTNNFANIFGDQVQTYILGDAITFIGDYAFSGCSNVTALNIPTNVTKIGNGAFQNCTGVESFTIPESVTTIGDYAFNGCPGISSVVVPNITSIRTNAFGDCSNITSVEFGNNLVSIGDSAFSSCHNLEAVQFPSSVQSIGNYAFYQCNRIPAIDIVSNITSLGEGAFKDCSNLTQVSVNSNAVMSKAYSATNNFSTIFGQQVSAYTLGDAITAIGDYAFYGNNISSVTISSSVASIGNNAFGNCSQLLQVVVNSNALVSKAYAPTNNFANIFGPQVQTYTLGDAITSIGDYAFSGCSNVTALNIPTNVTKIGNGAFQNCTGVESFTIPESVTTIGDYAFHGCSGISSVSVPNITSIGNNAFCDCSNITSVEFGNSLVSIGDSAFSSCYNLAAVQFPSSLQSIGNYAFYQCNRIPSVDIANNITSLGEGAFKGCSKLTQVSVNSNAVMSKAYSATNNFATIFGQQVSAYTLGDAITAIGDYAFYGNNISALTIPSSVTRIGKNAFQGCSAIATLTIPDAVTTIENKTFQGCTSLASITMPDAVTAIKDSAFLNCSSLVISSFPISLTSLGSSAFSGCSSISSIAFPATLKNIGENAFANCIGIARVDISDLAAWCTIDFANSLSNPLYYARNLYLNNELVSELVIPNRITELKNWTLNNCSSITSVVIPNTVKAVSPTTFAGCENIASIEWHSKNVTDYTSLDSAPFYASRKKVTEFVFGEEVEHVPAYLCDGMSGITSLAFPSYLKSIGDYAFKDLTKIRQINVPNEVTAIGAHAFDSCILVTSIYLGYQMAEVGDYAFKGCIRVNDITSMNTTTPVVYENTLSSISEHAYLYIPAGSKRTYQLDPYWSRFDLQEIASEEASLTRDAVTVEANADNALFTWPVCDTAAYYSLQITKDEVVFCTLVFNSNGQLTGIAFAPGRNGNAHAPAATTSVAGMSFTVTGLNSASKYAYRLAVSDEDKAELVAYSGEFATTGYTGEVNPGGEPEETAVDNITTDAQPTTKVVRDGQLFILRDGNTYSSTGVKVE